MKDIIVYLTLIVLIMTISTNSSAEEEKGYIPSVTKLTSNRLTPEVLWSFGRISGETVSPDQTKVLYGVTYYSIEKNKGFKDLYVLDLKTKKSVRITDSAENEGSASWRPDGKKIAYLSNQSGSSQLWEMNPDGSGKKQISFLDGDVSDFKYFPNGSGVVFVKSVKLDQSVNDLYPDLPLANARLETDLMYRHWDSWHDYTYNHLFIATYNEAGIFDAKDIMPGERYDAPMKPFGGMEQISVSPDGKTIAYTCKKKTGMDYSFSTNSEIWLYDVSTEKTKNLTEGIMGYDQNPVFSPDGKQIAWESMERDGYESDQARLFIADVATGKRTNLFENFEESAASITWNKDGKTIFFISDIQGTDEIFTIDLKTKTIKRLTSGIHNYKSIQFAGEGLLARKHSMSQPDELYFVSLPSGIDESLTQVTQPLMSQLKMGKVEKRWMKTTDGKDMLVWLIFPPDFDPQKKYPALLYCEGGPQSTVSQFWSYRWNFQMMAANDYIIVAPNRRGLPGFGKEWLEQISKDYGGQNIQDYLTAIDEAAKESYIDSNRLGCVGASYGGFSVYYLAGHHNKRFKAFISHCGIFNFEQMYTTTEEMWFENWDMGGSYWDKGNAVAQRSFSFSPHKFVDKWDTPILVIHGENDYRIPFTQGMAAYNAAIMRGIPAEFLLFRNENHWVLKPQNGILWQRSFFNWLDKWLK
jgi:dipeptidyl aminopeptidase/acylaminoacyl peptidase